MVQKIFYSWQSDLPNATNRGFIERALEKAVRAIATDESIDIEPVIDRDTLGLPGSPDIADAIFSKIDAADVFVADVSIMNAATKSRPSPNPNVLVELGYALKTLSDQRLILLVNTEFGGPEDLPFDLRMRRIVPYQMLERASSRKDERNRLAKVLETALRTILDEPRVIPRSSPHLQQDQHLFSRITQEILPSDGSIRYAREHDYGGSFPFDEHNDFHEFIEINHHPQFEFFDPEMESLRQQLHSVIVEFRNLLGQETFRLGHRPDWGRLPRVTDPDSIVAMAHGAQDEEEFKQRKEEYEKHLRRTHRQLNQLAARVVETYDEFVKRGRERLLV